MKPIVPCLAALVLALPVLAQEEPKDPDPEVLYSDESWTHIGDNNFSVDSDSASDLTLKASGLTIEIRIVLDEAARARLADPAYRTVLFEGTAIGNDTGRLGDTKATVVEIDGKKVGRITESGSFRIRFDKALLRGAAGAEDPNVLTIRTGANGANDHDDQEMGQFIVRLSKDPMPEPEREGGEK